MPCVSLLGSQLTPEDIIGIPQIRGNTSEFLPPNMIARSEPYVLFLDELNACSQEVQKAFYSLIHEKRIGEYHLPEGSIIIGAGNRAQDSAIVKIMSSALINRMFHVQLNPVPWDVQLAEWFDLYFSPLEKYRSYARPSRRQSCTPDIPRPRYTYHDVLADGRTFGVVIDTSGSMKPEDIGKALGAVASYANAHDVPCARVIFCDAQAYGAGYMSADDIAGRVEVKGRGGPRLQPGIDALQNAEGLPKDGPILIITDGAIESRLSIHRDHAFLLPRYGHLPFKPKGDVFYWT